MNISDLNDSELKLHSFSISPNVIWNTSINFFFIWNIFLPFYPYPRTYRGFVTPLQQTSFWKHGDKRINCSKRAISPFVTMVQLYPSFVLSFKGIFCALTRRFQSLLLQICHMWEKVNNKLVVLMMYTFRNILNLQ